MTRRPMLAVGALALLVACSPGSEGPLDIPTFDGATVTLIAESGPRERAIGNIRATNTGHDDVTITRVELVDATNVRIGDSALIVLPPDSMVLGAGFPIPPVTSDPDFDRLDTLWSQHQPAIGTPIAPGQRVNLVVGLEQVDKTRCASLDATTFEYTAGGRTYRENWGTTYRFTTIDGSACP